MPLPILSHPNYHSHPMGSSGVEKADGLGVVCPTINTPGPTGCGFCTKGRQVDNLFTKKAPDRIGSKTTTSAVFGSETHQTSARMLETVTRTYEKSRHKGRNTNVEYYRQEQMAKARGKNVRFSTPQINLLQIQTARQKVCGEQ